MRFTKILYFLLAFAISSTLAFGVDFKADPTFVSPLAPGDKVNEVLVLPDGDIMIAGEKNLPGLDTGALVMRLNPDGTVDPSFTLSSSINGGFGNQARIQVLQALPNGQYFIAGYFFIGNTSVYYARLNSDGSVDNTLLPSASPAIAVQADGKQIACETHHIVSGQDYPVAQRRNSNGTFDSSFRVTWADGGSCNEVKFLPDGKILVVGAFTNGGTPLKQIQRINSDGSLDASFDAAVDPGSGVGKLTILPDGKLMILNNFTPKRLLSNGALDLVFGNCLGEFLALDGSNYLMSRCKKWSSGPEFPFLRVSSTGVADGTQDIMTFGAFDGIRAAGSSTFFVFGTFSGYGGVTSHRIVRIIPQTTPMKAPFDFDGDGKSDLAVYRPSDGTWYLNRSAEGVQYRQWGLPTDKVAAGDADRDGKTDIGVFRDGAWHASSSASFSHHYQCLGQAGDKPMVLFPNVTEDTTGDRFAVRGVRSGVLRWFVAMGFGNCWNFPSQSTAVTLDGESVSDRAVAGDFNGDSVAEAGYFRDGLWYTEDAENLQAPASFQFGIAGDIPVPGDYDADRQTDYAIFRPSTGDWWINRSTDGILVIHWGLNGDIPVPGDYDGDGKVDVAIYRNGAWWQFRMGTGEVYVAQWGIAGDIPIPAQSQF